MNTRITRLVAAYEQQQRLKLARYYGRFPEEQEN